MYPYPAFNYYYPYQHGMTGMNPIGMNQPMNAPSHDNQGFGMNFKKYYYDLIFSSNEDKSESNYFPYFSYNKPNL
jgi:hypothetical protein